MTRQFTASARTGYLLIGMLVGALAITCSQPRNDSNHHGISIAEAGPTPISILPSPKFARVGTTSLADVAQRVVPGVVNISATRVVKGQRAHPFFNDPFFRDFFRHRPRMPDRRQQKSLGSGVIVSADGVVLTNNHVVEHAKEVRVTLKDGRDLKAKIIGTDPKSDLAVLRLQGKPKNLKPIRFGSSAQLRLGDVVLAIGNPFGVGQTVTMGIVSAKGRSRVGIVDYEDFIQTDAAINPGNSGGALVNMRGELVGINTAILSRTGGYQGIGFAIPSDMAKPIMNSLLKHGKVARGWLGVAIQDVTPDLARGLKLGVTNGVLISDVVKNSPAAKAGLSRGDVVVKLNGKAVRTSSALRYRIAALGPKARASLTVLRHGKRITLHVKLGSLAKHGLAQNKTAKAASKGLLSGLTVSNLTSGVRRKLRIDDDVKSGVAVTAVDPSSRAANAGVRVGDVILELNRKRVRSVADFDRVYDADSDNIVMLVRRGNTTIYLALRG